MATMIQSESITTHHRLKDGAVVDVLEIPNGAKPSLLFIHNDGEDEIVGVFADVLGQRWESASSIAEVRAGPSETIYGMSNHLLGHQLDDWDRSRLVINTHCVDGGRTKDETVTERCDYVPSD